MQRDFPKDSTSTWPNQDSNPEPPDPKAKCLLLDHDATADSVDGAVYRKLKLADRTSTAPWKSAFT